MKTIGERIKFYRKKKGYTQTELAEKLGENYDNKRISNWERNLSSPYANTIPQLAKILDCTPNDLLGMFAPKNELLTPEERYIIETYRKLDVFGKEVITTILDLEFERTSTQEKEFYESGNEQDEDFGLLAAHGSENLDEEGLKQLLEDAKRGRELLRKKKAETND